MGSMFQGRQDKLIAVCVAGIDEYAQTTYIDAMCSLADQYNFRLLFFTSFSGICMGGKYSEGEMAVYSLINYELLDGIVLLAETIKDTEVLASIAGAAAEAGVPVVTVDHPIDGCYNIVFDYRGAMEKLVRHMVEEHNFKKIEFIGGIPDNPPSEERLKVFRSVMEQNGRRVLPEQIHYGYFWPGGTEPVMDKICARRREDMPDALICANDAMALTACRRLQAAGFRVPEDVAVSGFDGIREAMNHIPSLTTACLDTIGTVRTAFDALKTLFDGGSVPQEILMGYRVICGESCGCLDKRSPENQNSFVQTMFTHLHADHYFVNQVMSMTTDLSECASLSEAADRLKPHLKMLSVWKCWICIVDHYVEEAELLQDILMEGETAGRRYTERMNCIVYREGVECQSDICFLRSEILPDLEFHLLQTCKIVVAPLHVMDKTIGYFAFTYLPGQNEFHRLQSFGNSLSNTLASLKSKTEHRLLIEKLEMQTTHDSLTGILNRRGFFQQLNRLYAESVRRGEAIAVLSVDMDGLKHINDTWGHSEGDEAIIFTANALAAVCGSGMFCARIGGDEFMVAGNTSQETAECFQERLQALYDKQNARSGKNYRIGFSLGMVYAQASEQLPPGELVRMADASMYEQKEEHRKQEGYLR